MDKSYWLRKFEFSESPVGLIVDGLAFVCILLPILAVLGPILYVVYILDQKHDAWNKKRQAIKWEKRRLLSEIGAIENENRLRRET